MKTFKRIVMYSRPYWGRMAIAALFSTGVGAMDGALAYMVEPLLKKIFAEKNLLIFSLLPVGIILLFIIRGICRYTNDYLMKTAGQMAVQDVRNEIYRRNMRLSLGFFQRQTTGGLMSRVLNDVNMMQSGVGSVISGLFREGLSAVSLLGVIFYRNWQLALLSIIVIPVIIYPAQKIGKRIKKLAKEGQGKMGTIASVLQETFSGIKVIKGFGLEDRETEKFCRHNHEFYLYQRKSIKYEALSTPVTEFITSFGVAAVIWVGGASVISGRMTAPEFFSFVAAMVMMYNPIKKLNGDYNVMQRSIGASDRVFEIIDAEPEIVDAPGAKPLTAVKGDVEFRNVSFSYAGDEVLKEVSLVARKGEVIALVGPSGGGKTTLVSLIPRFYDVKSGAVLVDGHDVRQLRQADLLRNIALVDQETILFNDTIANNIRYGKSDATDAEVIAAARLAYAHDFIMEIPGDYQTNIGDRGARLSGGQRQRLCIARAILKDTPILILDEATSALDTESEQMVQQALENLMANRTTFVIAHRLSTIFRADKIIVMENGEIRESGTHDELLGQAGLYKRLYDMQFR